MGPKTIWFKKILDYNILHRSQLIFQIRNPGHEIMITVFKINQNKSWNLISINSILKIKIKKKLKWTKTTNQANYKVEKFFLTNPYYKILILEIKTVISSNFLFLNFMYPYLTSLMISMNDFILLKHI
jgi:hypothetical protein